MLEAGLFHQLAETQDVIFIARGVKQIAISTHWQLSKDDRITKSALCPQSCPNATDLLTKYTSAEKGVLPANGRFIMRIPADP
jgi:hypothetical protein